MATTTATDAVSIVSEDCAINGDSSNRGLEESGVSTNSRFEVSLESEVEVDKELKEPYNDSFIAINPDFKYPDVDEASNTLELCRKRIIGPYNILLTVIGWRKFQTGQERCLGLFRVLNFVYPVFIFGMLVVACVSQVLSCFSRTKSHFTQEVGGNNETDKYTILTCDSHLFTLDIISYMLILISYILALYTFRVSDHQDLLSSLAETALLSFNDVSSDKSRKRPLIILMAILFCGIGFFVASIGISSCRLFALRLHQGNTIIGWFTSNTTADNQTEHLKLSMREYNRLHYVMVAISYFGFMFFDLLYIAVTINYCSQCQLLTYYIDNIQDKVRNKKYQNLTLSMKDIHSVYKFLKALNGYTATVASLIFLIFLSNLILSYTSLIKPGQHEIHIITGFLNTSQWLVATLFPVLLAAHLNASCNDLRRLGHELATRPFYYTETSDLKLHFFLTFTESTRYEVKLAFIPMQPSTVFGFGFLILLLISSGVVISQVDSVSWF